MTNSNMIQMENVSKFFQRGSETVHALENASLSIGAGEFVAVLGHSGSGKTTMLNLMGCLDRPTTGAITLNGERVEDATEKVLTRVRRQHVGFIFQQFFLIPTLTVEDNVFLPTLFAGGKSGCDAKEILERVGLGKRLGHLPSQLSGGEMQRVAIARALINDPPVLLADEPTGNLDSRNAQNIMSIFQDLHGQGKTIVMVTHNTGVTDNCTRVVRIEDGKLSI